MKILYLFILVVAAEAFVYKKELKEGVDYELMVIGDQKERNLDAPNIYSVVSFGFAPSSFGIQIYWHPLTSNPSSPIEGYKANLWEQERKLVWSPVEYDGMIIWVQKEELIDFPNYDVPTWAPRNINHLADASADTTLFYNLESQIWYDFRVQAYTLQEDGPFSLMYRIKFY